MCAFAALAVCLVLLIVVNAVCIYYSPWITSYFGGRGVDFSGEDYEQSLQNSDEVAKAIQDEGIILLKNDNDVLPLTDTKNINVFGWGSTDAGFVMSGSGSGSAIERGGGAVEITYFLEGLQKAGFNYNESLTKIYTDFKEKKDGNGQSLYETPDTFFKLYEPDASVYTDAVMQQALQFSDTALIVISRLGGEGPDLPFVQYKYNSATDYSRTYLEISTEEEALIQKVSNAGFKKVVAVINTCNVMELGFLENDGIDAAISVGGPGQSGCISIGRVLTGEVNPSAKTVDTYAYDLTTAASYANAPMTGSGQNEEIHGVKQYADTKSDGINPNQYIDYAEGIYVGYKWYETADAEHYWDSVDNAYGKGYDGVVQYPFGYGLSYTSFEWEIKKITPAAGTALEKDGKIEVEIKVTNVGSVAGKEVVELYYTPVYTSGGIEKSSLNLAAFGKTDTLSAGESETLTLQFDVESMKSYDCYDANGNGFCGYELEKGEYTLSVRTDAHTVANCSNAVISYFVAEDIRYETDAASNNKVENRFTGESAYAGVAIDGSNTGANITYLSRSNFAETFPVYTSDTRTKHAAITALGNKWYESDRENVQMPTQGSTDTAFSLTTQGDDGSTFYNEELMLTLGQDYNSEYWDVLLNQITIKELIELVSYGGFGTTAISSVGKPACIDLDGPSGLNQTVASTGESNWTIYPVEIVLASSWSIELSYRFGRSVGEEAAATGVSGWYAPGANIHRSPFGGRNFEYYSEDSLLSGYMCAYEVYGALSKGLYCYVKHFVAYEAQTTPAGIYTWMTEQALRETYLYPFEIAIKKGKANALMTSFNRLGANWTGGTKALLTDIVRNEWGFHGTIVTDWSSGGEFMDPDQGLRAGGDIWLNGAQTPISGFDDKTSAVAVTEMRRVAKDVLYTYTNTYYVATTEGGELSFRDPKKVSANWVWILVAVDIVGVVGIAVGSFFTVKGVLKDKKLKKESE